MSLRVGNRTRIYSQSKLCFEQGNIEIGDDSRICDFVFIYPGKGVKIGSKCDLQPGVKVWGGGELVIGDYVSIGPNTVLLTATYNYNESLHMVDFVPEDQHKAEYGKLVIEDDVYIGANCTIMPGITLGKGSVIGAGSFVNRNTLSFGLYIGSPARFLKLRPEIKR